MTFEPEYTDKHELPKDKTARIGLTSALRNCPIGQSFFVSEEYFERTSLASIVSNLGKRERMKFTCRAVVTNGVKGNRIWRLE